MGTREFAKTIELVKKQKAEIENLRYNRDEVTRMAEVVNLNDAAIGELRNELEKVVVERDAVLEVLRRLEWAPRYQEAGIFYQQQCPEGAAWKEDCALWAVLTTGCRQRPQAPSESDRWPPGANVGPQVPRESEAEQLAKEGGCRSEAETVVAWPVYDELLTAYLKLARERLLVNVMCIVSGLVAFVVLAVQVYKVLGRGYW